MLPRPLVCLLALMIGGCRSGNGAVGDAKVYQVQFAVTTGRIAVVGDTQRTLPVERWLLCREQNDPERERIVAAIAQERPDLLVHLGDAVADGSSEGDWAAFDRLMAPVRAAGIAVLPAVGNHDYWGSASAAMRNFNRRFVETGRCHWYARQYGDLTLIWLDSNRSELTREQWAQQSQWLGERLREADRDPKTKAVLVFCHHPPFTNSRATGDERDVQEAFLPPFCASRKTIAFITGHAHAYEHFMHHGKTFIVSGGGGGPRVRLLEGKAARHPDLYRAPSPRPFHYLLLRPHENGIDVEVKGFDKGDRDVRVLDRFTIAFVE